MEYTNAEDVYIDGLCMGCGTCIGVCPNSSLKIKKSEFQGVYFPQFDAYEECRNCKLCLQVCPGWKLDFYDLNNFCFGKTPGNIFIGNYLNCYTGYSSDDAIRYNCSSGGLATSLLIFALEEGIVDACLVTRMKKDNPLEPESFLARNKEEIIQAAGSKYCPVALNTVLKEISAQNKRFAIIGLPCHIQGIRLAQMHNADLRKKIILLFGLFCYQNYSFKATELLLKKMHIEKKEVEKISYRGKGWPGDLSIKEKSGREINLALKDSYNHNFITYSLRRCTLCSDALSELADISLGDAWLPEYEEDRLGRSIVIVRNKHAQDFLLRAELSGKVKLEEINKEKIIRAQNVMLLFKKKYLVCRLRIHKVLHRSIPIYKQELLSANIKDYLLTFIFYIKRLISRII